MIDSKDMALRGRIGGYAKAAKYSPQELTGAARAGFLRRFTPNDDNLSEGERIRRTQANLKAHMAKLARLSAIKRRSNKSKQPCS
ncbi:MAG TPA: hypothetical protein VMW50_07350 [Dehalococcoidia bacterium]|nr:hypothetical protein [Dehalococcoidia bacterium]